jgi:hypothetical protein
MNFSCKIPRRFPLNPVSGREMPGQARLAVFVRLPSLFPGHVVDPPAVRVQGFPTSNLGGHVHPAKGGSNCVYFVAHVGPSVFAHTLVQLFVRREIVQMLGYSLMVASFDKEAALAVLDLKGNATGQGGDDRPALHLCQYRYIYAIE